MKPHVHADVIKAWADGSVIKFRCCEGDRWKDVQGDLVWNEHVHYRVKPLEPERSYPYCTMTANDLHRAYFVGRGGADVIWSEKGLRQVANAALRHACDQGHVVAREEFDRALGDQAKRDMAVAKEVVKSLCWVHSSAVEHRFDEAYLSPVIARATNAL